MLYRCVTPALLINFFYVGTSLALGIPAPETLVAEAVTANQARLNGLAIADTDPAHGVTVYTYFRIGTSSPPTDTEIVATPESIVYPTALDAPFSAMAVNLDCGTRYYYRSGVRTAGGFVLFKEGGIVEFTTPGCAPPSNVSFGGLLSGLRVASDLVLLNNGGSPLTLNQTGAFSFPGGIATGSSYNVTVGSQPPGQTCRVVNGTGVANNNVNNLEVRCVNNLYRIGGTVTGLATGQRVRLVNNGVESLDVRANGAFRFNQGAAWNGRYNVVVGTQPATQTCTVTGGTGFNVRNNVTNILVSCSGETVVDGQTLPRSGLIYAPCGVSVLYQNMNYYTAPGRENTARIAICALTNARLTYPDFFNDRVTGKHELIGGVEVQGYARDYLATSSYGMVTLVQKTSGQTSAFQVTRPLPGPNNSGINVDFLDGSIGFTSHRTPPLPDLPNGRWTMWITRGGDGTEGWGSAPGIQLLPENPVDLGQVGEALNPNVNSQDIDWSAVQ